MPEIKWRKRGEKRVHAKVELIEKRDAQKGARVRIIRINVQKIEFHHGRPRWWRRIWSRRVHPSDENPDAPIQVSAQ